MGWMSNLQEKAKKAKLEKINGWLFDDEEILFENTFIIDTIVATNKRLLFEDLSFFKQIILSIPYNKINIVGLENTNINSLLLYVSGNKEPYEFKFKSKDKDLALELQKIILSKII